MNPPVSERKGVHMRRYWAIAGILAVGLLVGVVVWRFLPLRTGQAQDKGTIPDNYKDALKTPHVKLTAVLGTHEEDPAQGHTIAYAGNLKYALSTRGGYTPFAENVEDGYLTLWISTAAEWRANRKIAKGAVTSWPCPLTGSSPCSPGDRGRQANSVSTSGVGPDRRPVAYLQGLQNPLTAVAISPDGKRVYPAARTAS